MSLVLRRNGRVSEMRSVFAYMPLPDQPSSLPLERRSVPSCHAPGIVPGVYQTMQDCNAVRNRDTVGCACQEEMVVT